jgi:hypothetical protein
MCPKLRRLATRAARLQAHIRTTLTMYAKPLDLKQSAAYQERALRQDRTMLFDCMCLVADESQAIRDELLALMDSATPTTAMPGSKDKVATMEARAKAGYSIFIDGDSR